MMGGPDLHVHQTRGELDPDFREGRTLGTFFLIRFVKCTPDYLRPLEQPVHIGSSTNIWRPLKPSRMCSVDVVDVGSRVD